MTLGNCVLTHKPTSVSHSCFGYFTSADEPSLIIGKCTCIEIHNVRPQGLQLMQDFPIYGRIETLELFRPHGEERHLLFLVTKKYKFCVLQWDAERSELVTRAMGDASDCIGRPRDIGQIAIIDPDCKLIGFHLYDECFKVIPFGNEEEFLKNKIIIRDFVTHHREDDLQILDMKFVYGCPEPTIAVLSKDSCHRRFVHTYEVSQKDECLYRRVPGQGLEDNCTDFLIPVSLSLGGVLAIGVEKIAYVNTQEEIVSTANFPSTTFPTAYEKIGEDGSRYLLGDRAGHLHLIVIVIKRKKVGLKITKLLGETSIASTISYLDNDLVYVGSRFGDSQLIKLVGSTIFVLKKFINLGPIVDFCVVDPKKQGQSQVVTCSGAYKDGSLRVVRNSIVINELVSVELQGIKRMWSLRSSTKDQYDTYLVVSFVGETRILAINGNYELKETEIEGFCSQVPTLFCHDAIYDQLVQVTSNSVRLVSSSTGKQVDEWAPKGYCIDVATANASQVLLAGGCHLVYLKIEKGSFGEVKITQLDDEISCLDMNPTGEHSYHSHLAVVGLWTDASICVFTLPDLNLITKERLGGKMVPLSILLCSFEGISYLLCALGDGHLLTFLLKDSRELTDRKKVSIGSKPFALRTFSWKNATCVFAASDSPTVIHSSNRKLLYSNVNLVDVNHICQFNSAAFPNSLAIAKEGELMIGTVDDNQKLLVHSVLLGEQPCRICHQDQSKTFAICSLKHSQSSGEDSRKHFIRLLDDQTFRLRSTYELQVSEYGRSLLSCNFSGDGNVYYCVGTAYVSPDETEPSKGRILVLVVENGKLKLTAEKETKGAVYSLNSFNGNLLAAINDNIQLYKWMLRDDGSHELQLDCEHSDHTLALCVETRGNFIVVGDLMRSISLLIYKTEDLQHEEGVIEELAGNYKANWMSAVEILDDDVYLGAEVDYNLFTVSRKSEGSSRMEQGLLEVGGYYHLGEHVNRFRHGSLVMQLSNSDASRVPTVMFGTINGVIGVIAFLSKKRYDLLNELQSNLREVVKGVGGLSHKEWRSFCSGRRSMDDQNFLDGDLIESFLDLSVDQMTEIADAMKVPVKVLCQSVEDLTKLH